MPDEWTRASSAVATGSGHAAGSEGQFVDERMAAGGAGVAAHSVPPRRPCSVGWRGATVLCTRALRDAEWARLTAEYRETHASSCSPSGWRSAAAIDAMEPLFTGEEWPSLAHKKATLQRAREHALLSEFSAEELAQQPNPNPSPNPKPTLALSLTLTLSRALPLPLPLPLILTLTLTRSSRSSAASSLSTWARARSARRRMTSYAAIPTRRASTCTRSTWMQRMSSSGSAAPTAARTVGARAPSRRGTRASPTAMR